MTSSTPDPDRDPDPDREPDPDPDPDRDRLTARPAPTSRQDAGQPVLPDRTSDEQDVGWGSASWRDADDDERYLRERPPHWD